MLPPIAAYTLFVPNLKKFASPPRSEVIYTLNRPFVCSLKMATKDTLKAHAKRIERRDKIISLVTRSLTPLRYGSEPALKSSEIDPGDVAAFLCLPLAICGFSDYPPVCLDVARTSTRMPLGRHKLVIPGCITKAVDLHCTVQVKTNWDWKDVHNADLYLEGVEKLWNGNATSEKYALLYNQSSSY